jgi:hypothetical protein
MHPTINKKRTPFKTCLRQISNQLSDRAFASRRAMLETKRRIFQKLASRIQNGNCAGLKTKLNLLRRPEKGCWRNTMLKIFLAAPRLPGLQVKLNLNATKTCPRHQLPFAKKS